jgi:hypothetical protein
MVGVQDRTKKTTERGLWSSLEGRYGYVVADDDQQGAA